MLRIAPPTRLFCLGAAIASLLSTQVAAADKYGSRDFPSISRFAGSEIVEYQALDYEESTLPIKAVPLDPPPPTALLKTEGKITSITYRIPPGKTPLEVLRNYEQALGSAYKTIFSCAGAECGRDMAGYIGNSGKVIPIGWGHTSFGTDQNRYLLAQRSGPGGDIYVLLYAMQEPNHQATVFQRTVERKPMQTGQVSVIDAAALQRGLDAEGKVAVYGVFFDTGKADIKPESKASLDEMAKLLGKNNGLKVYIVGHTDNVGTLVSNLDLSQRRAEAVVRTLSSIYKIDTQRLVSRGVASLAPVTSNAEEAGRARNRRVELVVQ